MRDIGFVGHGELPDEYVFLNLCKNVYHCLPSELMEEDWNTVMDHLAMLDGESFGLSAR